MNKNLTAKNESSVLALVKNFQAKSVWQSSSILDGIRIADRKVSAMFDVPLSTVKAARYYW